MAWTSYQVFLALLMVITGSINTLSTKWGDQSKSQGTDGIPKPFNHPFVQAAGMFFGECICLFAFFIMRLYFQKVKKIDEEQLPETISSEPFNKFIFLLPALCDMTATSTMYLGLTMTFASSFQMLRGSLIVFTGIFTRIFLKRKLPLYKWLGIVIIISGLGIVGASDTINVDTSKVDFKKMITGDILIVLAQILTATQMILEEKFVTGRKIASLQAVGLEGLFGFIILSSLLVPMYYIKVPRDGIYVPIEDAIDAFTQIKNSLQITLALSGNILSIAFFNFAGISVTKEMSATTRTVLDSVRTLIIWLITLVIGWEDFAILQMFGFIALVLGMFIYNDVIIRPWLIGKGYLEPDLPNNEEDHLIEPNGPVMA